MFNCDHCHNPTQGKPNKTIIKIRNKYYPAPKETFRDEYGNLKTHTVGRPGYGEEIVKESYLCSSCKKTWDRKNKG